MTFQWTENLAVGVELMDEQHKELFARVNGFVEAITQGKESVVVEELMNYLESYVDTHFNLEETYMKQYDYDEEETEIHLKQHKTFRSNLERLKSEYQKKGATKDLNQKIQEHLCNWLITHVSKIDKKLGDYL
ncbi:MAG: bacteriohemerythrin [Candidatus Magnetominusculus sp. LBB02]|nr:bacteriohemerythrin [Candidatus Magnetominusculus sp. LBB02]